MTQDKTYSEIYAASRRLAILRLLNEIGGAANESIIHQGVEQLGFRRESRETIRDDLAFFGKHRLVKEEWFKELMVVSITSRGVEASEGRITVDGVQKPSIWE